MTDPRLVMAFPGESASRSGVTAAGPVDLISDPGLLEKFLAALSQLASVPSSPARGHAAGPAVPRGEDSAAPASTLRLDTAEEDWLAYTDDAKASLGPAMFRFIMVGVPGLRALAAEEDDGGLLTPTDKVIEERSLGLETDDDAGAVNDDGTGGDGSPAVSERPDEADLELFRGQTEAGRRRIRRLLTSAVTAAMPKYPAAQRLALLTAVLIAVQAGIWDSPLGEQGWIAVLSTALENLDEDRLGNLVTPTRISRERDLATRARIHNGPLGQHFPAAIEALTAAGFGLSDPPSQCPPGASFT